MNIDLSGRLVKVEGAKDDLRQAIVNALHTNGAAVAMPGDAHEPPFGLVAVSQGASSLDAPRDELDVFEQAIRPFPSSLERVVIVMSATALVPIRGSTGFSVAQAGLERMVRALAMEKGPNARVNGVAVGVTEGSPSESRMTGHTALGRAGTLDEVCAAVLFLLDPDNTYMTGHTLAVDGGWAVGYARNF